MRKLRLSLDALEVDSFETSWLGSGEGTVHGEQEKGGLSAGAHTQCGGVHTCGGGCPPTAGGDTHCGGIHTCGECQITAGGPTKCGGIHTCAEGCKS